MSADILDRLSVELVSANKHGDPDLADILRDAANALADRDAEIVRLRGEVCSCPSGDGSLRWPCKAHPPEAIAPAEAKGDPKCPDCLNDGCFCTSCNPFPQPADGGAVAWLPSAHEWLSENQGAASQDWMDGWNACRSRWQSITTQAPAVPTGAVWIMPVATDPPQNRNLMRMAWGASALSTGELANAYDSIVSAAQRCGQVITHPPATQVQGEAVDTLALRMLVAAGHVSQKLMDQSRSIARGVLPGPLDEATHPAGDALGAVRELPEKWRNRAAREGIVKSANWYATQLEAALQHRGDSREVGRG